jgi:hypothetical protein
MNASKENCRKAMDQLLPQQPFMNEAAFIFLKDFLNATFRRLPYDATIERANAKKAAKPKRIKTKKAVS